MIALACPAAFAQAAPPYGPTTCKELDAEYRAALPRLDHARDIAFATAKRNPTEANKAASAVAAAHSAAAVADYAFGRSELGCTSTPFAPGTNWEFVVYDEHGARIERFVFRLTDEPGDACLVDIENPSGWKRLEVVEADGAGLHYPVYAIGGDKVQILLSTAACDAYPMYIGNLTEAGFQGTYSATGLLGTKHMGNVYGAPIEQAR
jgi:hypothetical protein